MFAFLPPPTPGDERRVVFPLDIVDIPIQVTLSPINAVLPFPFAVTVDVLGGTAGIL